MGPTVLFMHLKIILLQYFQFSVSATISSIQTDSIYGKWGKGRAEKIGLRFWRQWKTIEFINYFLEKQLSTLIMKHKLEGCFKFQQPRESTSFPIWLYLVRRNIHKLILLHRFGENIDSWLIIKHEVYK